MGQKFSKKWVNFQSKNSPNKELRKKIEIEIDNIVEGLDVNFDEIKYHNPDIHLMWENYKRLFLETRSYLEEQFEEGAYINPNFSIEK